jgi:glycerol uptake operon antiterminator
VKRLHGSRTVVVENGTRWVVGFPWSVQHGVEGVSHLRYTPCTESTFPFPLDNPIIAACRQDRIADAVESRASLVLLMNGALTWLVSPGFQDRAREKPILIHMDLVKGLSGEREAILFIRDFVRPAGIVSTKSSTLRAARKEGLPAIQRVFLIDRTSLQLSIESIRENRPVAVELMPGIATEAISEIKESLGIPIIAAGLIRREDQILRALAAGADAISSSTEELWNTVVSNPTSRH